MSVPVCSRSNNDACDLPRHASKGYVTGTRAEQVHGTQNASDWWRKSLEPHQGYANTMPCLACETNRANLSVLGNNSCCTESIISGSQKRSSSLLQ